jgi:hypothetical protein
MCPLINNFTSGKLLGGANMKRAARRILASIVVLLSLGPGRPATASAGDLAPPDEPGPYRIGFAEGVIGAGDLPSDDGQATPVRIWYPSHAAAPPGAYFIAELGMTLRSVYGATQDAPVAAGPRFPIIVYSHPGASRSEVAYVVHAHINELLASHGFIVVSYLRVSGCANRIPATGRILARMKLVDEGADDALFAGVDLRGRIDLGRAGIVAYSGGGPEAIASVTHGDGDAVPRIGVMALVEPAVGDGGCVTGTDLESISLPYAYLSGSPGGRPAAESFLAATVNATPRVDIHTRDIVHFGSGGAGACLFIDQAREEALLRQLAGGAAPGDLVDPLGVPFFFLPFPSPGFYASLFWNETEGRRFCDNVGVTSVLSLDLDADGRTDSVALEPDPIHPVAVVDRMYRLYQVAFWKSFLARDDRYKRFLNNGYANTHDLPATITRIE